MNSLADMLWIELRKASRSRIPLFTGIGFAILPLATAFMMFIYKNPELARNMGLLSAKADLAGGSADWPFYLGMLAQGASIAGILFFSLIISWVFGREFSDGTLKDLLAVPVPRGSILLAKFIVVALWSAAITVVVYSLGLVFGAVVGLAQGSNAVLAQGTFTVAATAGLVILVVMPIAFFASIGRGYLLPMGIIILILIISNVIAVLGWGELFPWAIPGLYAGVSGKAASLEPASYIIVVLTGIAGIAGTYLWWRFADQSR